MAHNRWGPAAVALDQGGVLQDGQVGEPDPPRHKTPNRLAQGCAPCALRGADLEYSIDLLEWVRARLCRHVAELAAAADDDAHDGFRWGLSLDLSRLVTVVEILLERELERSRPSSTGG